MSRLSQLATHPVAHLYVRCRRWRVSDGGRYDWASPGPGRPSSRPCVRGELGWRERSRAGAAGGRRLSGTERIDVSAAGIGTRASFESGLGVRAERSADLLAVRAEAGENGHRTVT